MRNSFLKCQSTGGRANGIRTADRFPAGPACRLAFVLLWLVYASGKVNCWAETTLNLVPVVNVSHPGCGEFKVLFSQDGKYLISTGAEETCVWNVATGLLQNKIKGEFGGYSGKHNLIFTTVPPLRHAEGISSMKNVSATVASSLLPGAGNTWDSVGEVRLFVSGRERVITSKINWHGDNHLRVFPEKLNDIELARMNANIEVRDGLSGALIFALDGLFQSYDPASNTISTYSPHTATLTEWDFASGEKKGSTRVDTISLRNAPPLPTSELPEAPVNHENKISAHLSDDSVVIRGFNDSRDLSQFTIASQGTRSILLSNRQPFIIREFGNACAGGLNDNLVVWSLLDDVPPTRIRSKWLKGIDGLPGNGMQISGTIFGDLMLLQTDLVDKQSEILEIPFRGESVETCRIPTTKRSPSFYLGHESGLADIDPVKGTIRNSIVTNVNLPKGLIGTGKTFSSPDQSLVLHCYKVINEVHVGNAQATLSVFDTTQSRHLGFITQKMDYGPVAVSSNSICCINNRDELCLYSKARLSRPIVLATSQNRQGADLAFNPEGSILYGFAAKQADFRSPLVFTAWRVIDGAKLFEQPLPQAALPGRFTIDGNRLVTQQGEIFDASNGKLLYQLKRPLWDQFALATDASRLIEASVDSGVTRISDLDTGVELASLYTFNRDKDWLVTTPDGYFDGSPGGIKLLSYRDTNTNELIPLERYRKQFEVPGLLPKVWEGEEFRKSKTQKMEAVPIVRITSPKQSDAKDGVVEMSGGKLTVQATAESRGSTPITELRLKIEGEPIDTPGRIVSFDESANSTVSGSWSLDLKPGKYEMSVVAHDANTYGISDSLTILNLGGGLIKQEKPNLYVLAIGIADYENGIRKLDYADTDAQAVVRALRSYSGPLFNKIEVKELVDKQATKTNILKKLNWLNRNATERDYVVVYYAGHGKLDRNMYYLLPVDADPEDLFSTAIDKETLKRGLLNLPGKVLVMFDSCHSGALGRSVESDRGFDGLLKDLNSDENGIAYLSATNSDEEAMENRQLEKGHFTAALIEGLSGKGTPEIPIARIGAGEITYTELERYITKRVKQLTNGRQHVGSHRLRTYHQDFPVSLPPK